MFMVIFAFSLFINQGFCGEKLQLFFDPPIAWQGKVITITAVSPEGVTAITGSFLNNEFKFYRQGNSFRGIVGVPVDQKTGSYPLKLAVTKGSWGTAEVVQELKVWKTKFPFSRFWLPPARNKLRARTIIDDEWGRIEQVLVVEDLQKRWQGEFGWPTPGPVSQGFGHRQIINGKGGSNHRGVDIAVTTGTKILAPNNGKVVFADQLKAFGGTIVLDHGWGIHTLYFHLSKFAAEVGDEVTKGALVAYSGNSGVSSGAHLHWGMSVHNLRVDPIQWIKHEL
ncbi:hypothetical protein A3H38_04975 [candidate division WOR-1 bacterium RIFCSPLOWO2_02_FULL_46_20]|nr:MAG: hypothetical protein A3H38_04975 [candidate division WOR-1 bacterium RIFCSPLOWO2_02_FULL_46_20]